MDFNEKSMAEIVANYRDLFKSSFAGWTDRLPIPLFNEEDTYYRLVALISLEVENRGNAFDFDLNTRDKALRVARWLTSSQLRGLILMGSLGNGKSTMLKAIHLLFKRRGTLWNANEIYAGFKDMRMLFHKDSPFLLIDDLGVEADKCMNYGEVSYPVSQLLLYRYDRRLTTIIATNLGMPEIQQRYGARVADRLAESYGVITYDAESYRLR